MDQKRLLLAIGISIAILLGFQVLMPHAPKPVAQAPAPAAVTSAPAAASATPLIGGPELAVPANVPRVKIAAPRVEGSISLLGARLDDLVLKDYRETVEPNSPLVRILEPRSDPQPYYIQYGWTATDPAVKVPTGTTLWTATGQLTAADPVTLQWDNGAGLVFEVVFAVDSDYMFDVKQRVRNSTGAPVSLFAWSRIKRDYLPQTAGYYVLHEGLLGVLDGTLKEMKYDAVKTDGQKNRGVALELATTGGWAGITDKYWLTALIPNREVPAVAAFRFFDDAGREEFQVDFVGKDPQVIAPGAVGEASSRAFAGAKVVSLLDYYETQDHILNFDKAVDFGWFYFLTKPMFYALDWLYGKLGNFGLAILVFTVLVKGLFFPLANKSYRSMSKMKLLAPKIAQLRETYKEDPAKLQSETMRLYKAEKVNPASGCLPMLIQIPVFFSLYKVIFVTIEMRQAPFYGWIKDLSVADPTNLFNLFGLLPFNPIALSPMLHLGAWPLIMGFTMFFQQKLNPPPPDPVQAKVFQFMPIIFTFMLASFPAGLVLYWSWNNLLTIGQQWLIMRQTNLSRPGVARVN